MLGCLSILENWYRPRNAPQQVDPQNRLRYVQIPHLVRADWVVESWIHEGNLEPRQLLRRNLKNQLWLSQRRFSLKFGQHIQESEAVSSVVPVEDYIPKWLSRGAQLGFRKDRWLAIRLSVFLITVCFHPFESRSFSSNFARGFAFRSGPSGFFKLQAAMFLFSILNKAFVKAIFVLHLFHQKIIRSNLEFYIPSQV